jgi:hypothetical protein
LPDVWTGAAVNGYGAEAEKAEAEAKKRGAKKKMPNGTQALKALLRDRSKPVVQ